MTKGYVQAEIDKIKGVADYNIKLTTELDTEDESKAPPAKATRKEKKKKAKKTRLSKLQYTSSVHIDEMEDEDLKEWKGRGVGLAESFNLTDLKQVLKLHKHLYRRGNWELFTTPKNGSCAFASIRRGMEAPEEFRNNHLRFMVVKFMATNHAFCYSVLKSTIAGEYGMDRLPADEFAAGEKAGTLTVAQTDAQSTPGPYTFIEYLEAMLQETTWGDYAMLTVISMMWQVTITILRGNDFKEIWIRHRRSLRDVDFVVVYCGSSHYLGTCEYHFHHFRYMCRMLTTCLISRTSIFIWSLP